MRFSSKTAALTAAISVQTLAVPGLIAQVVYTDDFSRANTSQGFVSNNVAPFSNAYSIATADTTTFVSSPFAGSAAISNGLLQLYGNGSGSNRDGAVWVSTPLAFNGFNNRLASNTGKVVSWAFNIWCNHTSGSGLSGFNGSNYGVAYVLGATSPNFQSQGAGYAVMAGQSGTFDPWTLVAFTNGLSGSITRIVSDGQTTSVTPLYHSLKVEFDTTTSKWTLYDRSNGTSGFSDARTDFYGSGYLGADTSPSYASTALNYTGAYWKASTAADQNAKFDNLQIELSDAAASTGPRTLTWNGASEWNTTNAWKAPAAVTWNSSAPDNAVFANTGSTSVVVGSATSVGSITFSNPGFSIAGPGTLSIAGAAGAGVIANESATISANVTLSGSQVWTIAAGRTLALNGTLSGAATLVINAGRVEVHSPGGTTVSPVIVNTDILNVQGQNAANPAAVVLSSSESLINGTLGVGRSFVPALAVLNDLQIGLTASQLDITTNDLIVRATGPGDGETKLARISDYARQGQSGDALFVGNGLVSSVAAADATGALRFAVGVAVNNIDGGTLYDTFDGITVGPNDVLVKFTYFGDADLNGLIDDSDFFLTNNGYGNGLTGWINGDFDYSGQIDDSDFFLINNAYGLQSGLLRAAGSGLPEPSAILPLAFTAALYWRRRRPR